MTDPSAPAAAYSRHRIGVVVAVLGGVATLGPAAMDLYMPALPTVASDLGTSTAGVALTMTAFLVGMGVGMVFLGSLSDSYGRRTPLLVGLALYVVAAVGCSLAPTVGVLIVMRALLGMASAGGFSIGQAVITDYARGARAARLMSRLALVSYLAPILAPPIGAQMLRVVSWRGIFVVLAVLGVAVFATAFRFVGESLPRERRIPSGVSSTLHTAARLFRDRHYVGLLLTAACASAAFFAYLTGVSLVFQEVGGLTPTAFSIFFTINAAGMLASTQLNHRLLGRYSPRQLLYADLVVSAVAAVAAVAASFTQPLNVVALAVPLFVLVSGMAATMPNAIALALSLHPEIAGSAAAVFGATGIVLGALATPLVGIRGTSAVSMTLVILAASVASLVVFVLGPRRYPDLPEAASLEPQGDIWQA